MFAKNEKPEIIIAGGGYFGTFLARQIDFADNQITVIDISSESLADLQTVFTGKTVEGDASSVEILQLAGIDAASAVIAATDDDHVNLMIARIASEIYGIKSVIAIVRDASILIVKEDYSFSILCPALLVTQNILTALKLKEG